MFDSKKYDLLKDYVLERLIEAAQTWEWAVSGAKPPKHKDSVVVVSDGLIGGYSDAWKKRMMHENGTFPHTIRESNKKVTNATECLDWLSQIPKEDIRSGLSIYVGLKAKRIKIGEYCKKNGISRANLYRQKDNGLQYLVFNVPLRHHLRDIQKFDSVRQNQAKSRANHITSDEFRPRDGQYFQEGVLEYDKKGKAKRVQ